MNTGQQAEAAWGDTPKASAPIGQRPSNFLKQFFERLKPARNESPAAAVARLLASHVAEARTLEAERDRLTAALGDDSAEVSAVLGGKDAAALAVDELRLGEITKRLAALARTVQRLKDAEAVAKFKDSDARAVALLPVYSEQLAALSVALANARVAYEAAAATAGRLLSEHFDQDALRDQVSAEGRPMLRRSVDQSVTTLAWTWRRDFSAADGNPSRISAWEKERAAFLATLERP